MTFSCIYILYFNLTPIIFLQSVAHEKHLYAGSLTLNSDCQWYQISRMGLFILLKVKNYRTLYIRMSRHLVYLPASHQT